MTVARATAAHALFALHYPSGGVTERGCSTPPGDLPSVCTYEYGAGQGILTITSTPYSSGWGVTSLQLQS